MKLGKVLLTLAVLSVVGPTSAFATNGSDLIGFSAASSGLGGTGVANYTNETDAIFKNPALLGDNCSKIGQITAELYGSFFQHSPSASVGGGLVASKNSLKVLPGLGVSYKFSDRFTFGIAGAATGGGIVDYTGNASLFQVKVTNTFSRIAPTIAFHHDIFSAGLSVGATQGALAVNEAINLTNTQSARDTDTRWGLYMQGGASVKATSSLQFGGAFMIKQPLNFKQIVNLNDVGPSGPGVVLNDIKVEQPAEASLGVGYDVTGSVRLTLDYRYIFWSRASGYHELGWRDQNILALGGSYKMDKVVLRAGVNYGQSPIQNTGSEDGDVLINFQGANIYAWGQSILNIVAFPALSQTTFTLGGGYEATDNLSLDLAFLYSPSTTITRSGHSGHLLPGVPNTAGNYTFTATLTQWSLTAGATYKF